MMLRRARSSAAVRVALCAAALLSVVAAFGLHPEPPGMVPDAQASLAAKASLVPPAHECPACLNAGSALVTVQPHPAPLPALARTAERLAFLFPPARPAGAPLSGRAPPAPVSS